MKHLNLLFLATILFLLPNKNFAQSLHLNEELSFSSDIGLNLASKYLARIDLMADNEYVVINTNIPFEENGMTSITIRYWGYNQSWETVVGWYIYNDNYYSPNAYANGIAKHKHVKMFNKNDKIAIAIPKNAFSMYGSISVSKNISGIGFSKNWMKNWNITTGEIPSTNKIVNIPLTSSENTQDNFATKDLNFKTNRIHDLASNNLSLMNGKLGIGTNRPSSVFHIKTKNIPTIILENEGEKIGPNTSYKSIINFSGGRNGANYIFGRMEPSSGGHENFGLSNGQKSIFVSTGKAIIGADITSSPPNYSETILLMDNTGIVGNTKIYEHLTVMKSIRAANSYFKVSEDGHVFATKITVEVGPFPDYVFDKKYKLNSIKEVAKYIQKNSKLPNMPSAKTIKKEGADLGELTRLQQEKIEELTLYIIELNNRLLSLEGKE